MMIKTFIFSLCVCCICIDRTIAANADYDPHWTTNDSWYVDVCFWQGLLFSDADEAHKHSSTNINVSYVYKVNSVDTNTHTAVIGVSATNEDYSYLGWTFIFDINNIVLLTITNNTPGVLSNPFKGDAWFIEYGIFDEDLLTKFVAHFPKLPNLSTNEIRSIDKGYPIIRKDPFAPDRHTLRRRVKDMSGSFTQTLEFSTNKVIAIMCQPYSGIDSKVTFVWEKGKKWWKTATVNHGTNVAISATLRE